MLERTAASLESCNLQRVIPKSARSTRRCHQLHTGFWQHGASAIELSSIYSLPVQALDVNPVELTPRPLQTGLVASAFLLDFLYPNGTLSLLRRLYPSFPRAQDSAHTNGASRRRSIASSTIAPEADPQSRAIRRETNHSNDARNSSRFSRRNHKNQGDKTIAPEVEDGYKDTEDAGIDRQTLSGRAASPGKEFMRSTFKPNASGLEDLLSREDEELYRDAWDIYCRLDETQQIGLRREMVLYLSKSRGIVDTGRAVSLFRQIPIDKWDNDLLASGILALMRSGNLDHAINSLKAGMEFKGLIGGLEYVLADTIANQKWSGLIGIWFNFFASRLKFEPDSRPDDVHLQRLENLPGLDRLFFSFEQYLSTDGAKVLRPINLYPITKQALSALRQKLGELALAQPCQPKQAVAILGIFNDRHLYQNYLLRILNEWQGKADLKSNITWISEIYRTYRELPGAQPSIPLLQGMFNLHFPANLPVLKEIYLDWRRTWGELDQWGFEKFLKLYAGAGDVQAVRELWERYIQSYPRVLKKPRAFRSTMNVYAQVGDAAKAEEELHRMTEQYGVKPDLDIWNTLLKCYMRAHDYDRVLACFKEICTMYRPDSFTYSHIMAMAAKKGDLESTLKFLNKSQKDGIAVSREMAMSLVMVYCRNDQLMEAERICVELAERKATSTAIWNQLIHFNGMQGRLNKCYELLQAMRSFDLVWDHQTHEFLLQALVRVDQVQPAYRLLRAAHKEKLFPVGPEHFAIVMAGAVRTGELKLVEVISSHLEQAGQTMNFNAQVSLAEASFRRMPSSNRARQLGKEFVTQLRNMLVEEGKKRAGTAMSIVPGDLRYLRKQTKGIGRAIKVLVALRDFTTAEEVVNIYTRLFPKYKSTEPLPPEVVSALMLGYLKDRKFSSVIRMWNQTWENVHARAMRRQAAGIYPIHQYDVSRPISIVAQAYREDSDGKGLRECVEKVTTSGFKLTRNNWNLLIRYLAEMGQWEPAMRWCETMLMPRWRGWSPVKRSLQERRHMRNTRVLQASNAAVLSLQHQWLKLRKLGDWSAHVSAKLGEIEKKYPRLHYAFTTTDFEHLNSSWDGRRKKGLRSGAKEMLKPFSHAELVTMEKKLKKQLRLSRRRRPQQGIKKKRPLRATRKRVLVRSRRLGTLETPQTPEQTTVGRDNA